MADLRKEFGAKTDPRCVPARSRPRDPGADGNDHRWATARATGIFDVLMTRFEVLLPYRPALRRIAEDLR